MTFKLLDVVVVIAGFPDRGVAAGDTGTIVDVYPDGEFEVEFINDKGETTSMFAIPGSKLRPVGKVLQAA